jgi:hypothetical protein
VIVQNAAEERCIRSQWSRDSGRAKANALQRDRADALALELAPEILALRARGSSYREIAQALNECDRPSARGGRWAAGTLLRLTRPVPLTVGISRQIREALRAETQTIDRKAIGRSLHRWTMQGAYLYAITRGEVRRNLDGSAARVPDDAARQYARKLLDERAARRAEQERQKQTSPDTAGPGSSNRAEAPI